MIMGPALPAPVQLTLLYQNWPYHNNQQPHIQTGSMHPKLRHQPRYKGTQLNLITKTFCYYFRVKGRKKLIFAKIACKRIKFQKWVMYPI